MCVCVVADDPVSSTITAAIMACSWLSINRKRTHGGGSGRERAQDNKRASVRMCRCVCVRALRGWTRLSVLAFDTQNVCIYLYMFVYICVRLYALQHGAYT